MIAALAALALAAPAAASTHRDLPLEVLEAGEVEYDVALKRGRATGGVVLRRGLVTLRAQSALYDDQTGEVDASGGVLLLEPGRALSASAMHAVLDGPYEARDVVAFLKDAPLDLSRCRTVADVRAAGHGRVEVGGAVLRGVSGAEGDPFEVERARITLCDCGGGPPSWEIRSRRASVTPGKGAFLTLPVIYITPRFLFVHTPVPVMVLPVLYLPLGERQTGLLVPSLELGGVSGVTLAEPLYLTLGRSWDATITPSWSFGPSASGVSAAPGGAHGVKGLGAEVEVRWAPAEGTSGTFRLFEHKSEIQDWPTGIYRPAGMNRVAIALTHDQRLSDATYLKAEAGLVGDPLYLTDFTGDALLRAADYRRSGVALEHRRDDVVLEVDAAYHLPVNVGFLNSGRPAAAPFGLFGGGLDAFHRIPSASAALLPVEVAGPLRLSGQIGVARFAPLRGPTGDEGLDQIGPGERGWGANVADAGENDGRWQVGERLAATRASARAELRAPISVGDALALEPWLAGTALGYSFEAGQGAQANAWAVGGLRASTALARGFGTGAARLLHVFEPSVEVRAGTPWAGPNLPAFAYDELDVALPPALATPVAGSPAVRPQRTLTAEPGAFQQVRLALRNRLLAPAGALSRSAAELAVGLDADAGHGKLSESWAEASLQVPYVVATAGARAYLFGAERPAATPLPEVRARSWLDRFTELRSDLHVGDGRGDEVHAGLTAVGPGGSPRLLAGLEPFFDPRAAAVDAVALGSVGVRARISGATITYDALFNARPFVNAQGARTGLCDGKTPEPHFYQQQATFVWDSPCRCWKAGVQAVLNECDARPRFTFVIDLSSVTQRRPTF